MKRQTLIIVAAASGILYLLWPSIARAASQTTGFSDLTPEQQAALLAATRGTGPGNTPANPSASFNGASTVAAVTGAASAIVGTIARSIGSGAGAAAAALGIGGAGAAAAGLLPSASIAGLHAAVPTTVGLGASSSVGSGSTAAAAGGIGTAGTIAITGGIAGAAVLAWAVWKRGLFRGGEEALVVNPARDAYLAIYAPYDYMRDGNNPPGFYGLASLLTIVTGESGGGSLFSALTRADRNKAFLAATDAIDARLASVTPAQLEYARSISPFAA